MRLVTVGALLLLFAIIISTIVITPFYFTSKITLGKTKTEMQSYKNSVDLVVDADSQKIIDDTNNKINILKGYQNSKKVSIEVLDKITINKSETISINSITYNKMEDTETVSIGGIAKNREELKGFVYKLMNVADFTNVSVPISNYLRGTDLEFVITLNLAKKINN